MTKNKEIGSIGEDLASEYLKNKGYQILVRNYGMKFGEIDIITRSPDLTMVFIEVKTILRDSFYGLSPEDNLTTQKYNNVKRMCEFFIGENPGVVDEEMGWRIDLVAIDLYPDGDFEIRHYENV